MKTLKVNKNWLVDEFIYREYTGKTDRHNQELYIDPIRVENCKIDFVSSFKRQKNSVDDDTQAIIFCFASATTPFKLFKKRSKVEVYGEMYEIIKVFPYREPQSKELWSIELEVG